MIVDKKDTEGHYLNRLAWSILFTNKKRDTVFIKASAYNYEVTKTKTGLRIDIVLYWRSAFQLCNACMYHKSTDVSFIQNETL